MKPCDHTCARSRVGGSVMMEFVLVVPIYLLLFGGTFWVGEMMLSQDMRMHSARATTWAYGLRGTDADDDLDVRPEDADSLLNILKKRRLFHWIREVNNWTIETTFDTDTVKQVRYLPKDEDDDTPSRSWTQIVGGAFLPVYGRSAWTHGWFEGGRMLLGSVAETRDADLGDGSGTGPSQIYYYRVVMRTKGGENSMRHLWTAENTVAHLTYEEHLPVMSSEWMKMVRESYPWDDVTWRDTSKLNTTLSDVFSYSRPKHWDYRRYKMLTNWSNQRTGIAGVFVDGIYNDVKAAVEDVVDAVKDGVKTVDGYADRFNNMGNSERQYSK